MTDVLVDAEDSAGDPVVNLGGRLKAVRLKSGMSLRELARQLSVSPSFISQMENGKSQPSVATLYSMAQLLDVSIDELFAQEPRAQPLAAVRVPIDGGVSRSDFTSPADAWPIDFSDARICRDRPRGPTATGHGLGRHLGAARVEQ